MANRIRLRGLPTAAAILLVFAGCASSPAPYQELARAEASIDQAEKSGARQYGAVELDDAKEKLNRAQTAVRQKDMKSAKLYAEEAALSADLASAKARSHKAQSSVQEIEDGIATLREEIARNQRREGDTE